MLYRALGNLVCDWGNLVLERKCWRSEPHLWSHNLISWCAYTVIPSLITESHAPFPRKPVPSSTWDGSFLGRNHCCAVKFLWRSSVFCGTSQWLYPFVRGIPVLASVTFGVLCPNWCVFHVCLCAAPLGLCAEVCL